MTEDEYREAIWRERHRGLLEVDHMLREWRRELWPDPYTDPISREERMKRFRRELAVERYWGAAVHGRLIYGGICAG